MYFRNSMASGGASLPTAKPLPPPNPSVGFPAPPSTLGNGNHWRSQVTAFLSAVFDIIVPGAHWPCSSIAESSTAVEAAEPPAPSQTAARKPSWNGCLSTSSLSFVPAATKQASVQSPELIAASSLSLPHS